MKVFSSRYSSSSLAIRHLNPKGYKISGSSPEFLSSRVRTRIESRLQEICSSDDVLERFLLLDNRIKDRMYLQEPALSKISKLEIGYDIVTYFDPKGLVVKTQYGEDGARYYDDFKLFDLIEILIIFAKEDKRELIKGHIDNIFRDESVPVAFYGWMLTIEGGRRLHAITPLLKNKTLRGKLQTIYAPLDLISYTNIEKDAQAKARNAADIVQYIFSAESGQTKTKAVSEQLIAQVAKKWTTPSRQEELGTKLNELVKLTKELNNQVANIRHTDKHTIEVNGVGLFDLIAGLNTSIAELVISSLQDQFIESSSATDIKNKYINDNNIVIDEAWYIPKEDDSEPIDLSEIPF